MGAHSTKRQLGATLAEFALVAPLLFLLIFGIVEFGRMLVTYTSVFTAAREGARYGTTVGGTPPHYLDCGGIEGAAMAKSFLIDLEPSDITIVYDDGSGTEVADCQGGTAPSEATVPSGSRIVVTVDTTFNTAVPLMAQFLDGVVVNSEQKRTIFTGVVGGP